MLRTEIPLSQRIYRSKYSQSAELGNVQHSCGPGRVAGYKEWTYDRMDRVIHAVCDGISIRQAAEEYKVPKSTLGDRNEWTNTTWCKE